MASSIVSDDELRQRFEREAKAVARLQHANIVTIYDLGYDDSGYPFIAMELLKGTDLEPKIRKNLPSFGQRLEIVAQVCRGLAHAHGNGIVHRDIKPANVFVLEGGGVKIMDFGVARWMQSSQTQTGAVLGTADYMSPEQIRGQKVDGRSDIFSIGIILYRLLTKKPFAGENIQATFYKILTNDPPLLILPDGQQVDQLQDIVDRALAKDADERYESAEEMADDIKEFIRVFEGVLPEDTLFDTAFDPESAPGRDTPSGVGSGRRGTVRPGSSGRVGRTSPGSTGRSHRTARGTSVPPTAMGGAGQMATSQTKHTAIAGRTAISPATRVVPRPAPRKSWTGLFVAVAAVLAIGAGAAYWYFNLRGAGTGNTASGTNAATTTTPSPEVLNRRFDFAEDLLEKGQVAQAFEVVQNILLISKDNGRALELQARIQEASAHKGGNSAAAQAQTLAADATMAIAGGQLGQARSLIAQGRGVDPSNPRWDQLSRQVQDRARQYQTQESQRRKAELLSGYLQQATKHIEAGDYDSAIATYDSVLSEDPTNAPALSGKAQATGLRQQVELARKRQEELQQKTAIAPTRSIVPSKTEYTAPGGQDGPKGFESGGVKVRKATGAPTFPAEVMIEVNPPNAQPGQPYVLRVRMHNEGTHPFTSKVSSW